MIYKNKCDDCGKCIEICPTGALTYETNAVKIREKLCVYCYGCVLICPKRAIIIRHNYRDRDHCVIDE